MRKVIGLGISLWKTAVCVLSRDGQLVWQGKVESNPGLLSRGSVFGETGSIRLA